MLSRNNSQTHLQYKKSFAWEMNYIWGCISNHLNALFRKQVIWCSRYSVAVQVGVTFWKSFWQLFPWKQWGSVLWHFCKVSTDEARARLLKKAVGHLSKICGVWPVLLRGGQASTLTVQCSDIAGICPASFVAVAQAQANERQGYHLFLMSPSKQTFVQSYIPRNIVLASEWPLFLLRKVTVAGW